MTILTSAHPPGTAPPVRDLADAWAFTTVNLLRRPPYRVRVAVEHTLHGPRVLALLLRLEEPSTLKAVLAVDEPLALALSMATPAAPVVSVRLARLAGWVACEIALPAAYHRPLPLSALPPGAGMRFAVGQGVTGAAVELDLASPVTCHLLIAGTTGSGKTTAVQSALLQLFGQNLPEVLGAVLIDGKSEGLIPFGRAAHLLHPVITDAREAAAALAWLVGELDRRKAGAWAGRVLLVVDEVAPVLDATGGARGAAAGMLARLLAQGRGFGISVILTTQYPSVDTLGGSLARANLPARIVGRVASVDQSALACGVGGMKAHRLTGAGDMLALAGGESWRVIVGLPDAGQLAAGRLDDESGGIPFGLDLLDLPGAAVLDAGDIDGWLRVGRAGPDDLTVPQVAWALAEHARRGGPPARRATCSELGIGDKKARRLIDHAGGITEALASQGARVVAE